MSEKVRAYFEKLKKVSSRELDLSAKKLVLSEKQKTSYLIAHITEIKDRKYYLKLGYKNMFEYCVRQLNLSEGSVWRRLQVVGVCRRFPQILEALSTGLLHLTGASLIAPLLTEKNVNALIAEAQGKTKREIEAFLVKLNPKEVFKSSCRKLPCNNQKSKNTKICNTEEAKLSDQRTAGASAQESRETESEKTCKEAAEVFNPEEKHDLSPHSTRTLFKPATEDRYNFRFSAGKEFKEKFERLAEVLGIESPGKNMEEIMSRAFELALEKKDPEKRLERRRKREEKRREKKNDEQVKSSPGKEIEAELRTPETSKDPGKIYLKKVPAQTRYVSPEVRDRVFEKAGFQCEYSSPDGLRCSSRTGLQIEHTLPFAVYHSHDEKNLKVFCPAHNLFSAEQYYGRDFINQKIETQRQKKLE